MKAHQVIDGIQAMRNRDIHDPAFFDMLEMKVAESQKFEFDFGDFPVLSEDEMQRQMQSLKTPYRLCFFSIPTVGALLTLEHEDCILAQPFLKRDGQIGTLPPEIPIYIDKRDGSICCGSEDPMVIAEWQDPSDKGMLFVIGLVGLVVRGLVVLNCSNVICIENPPPPALNKKRERSGKVPIFSYKTLHIMTSDQKQNSKTSHDNSDRNAPRLHMRRGHVRRLTTGVTTWVQSCMVGSAIGGMVMKDYRVT